LNKNVSYKKHQFIFQIANRQLRLVLYIM
jgi:hypothetical protein